jgi:hypothetical protein
MMQTLTKKEDQSMPLDLGIGQEEMEALGRIKPINDGTYEFIIERPEIGSSNDGKPMWIFYLRVVNSPEYPNRSIRYGVVVPHIGPDGKVDMGTAPGFLVPLNNEVGVFINWHEFPDPQDLPWVKSTYEGKGGFMAVGHKPRKGDPETIDNTVRYPKWEAYKRRKK